MTDLTAVSLFAGIGGFDLALERAGVHVVAAVEIDPAARSVLRRRFPDVTLFEDVTEVTGDQLRAAGFVPERGILTGGFPCQDLSVAGRRRGMGEGTRSGLYWEIDRLLADLRPAWVFLENVPGLLSAVCPDPDTAVLDLDELPDLRDDDGFLIDDDPAPPRDGGGRGACDGGCFPAHGGAMGLVLGSLADRGYGFAYRVLDAQHFGVPQRRRRVFIVGRAGGDARGPVEVLLEPEGRGGDPSSGREAGTVVAALTANGVGGGGGPDDNAAQAGHLIVGALQDAAHGQRLDADSAGAGHLIVSTVSAKWAKGTGGPSGDEVQNLLPVAFDAAQITSKTNRSNPKPGDPAPSLAATGNTHVAPVAVRGRGQGAQVELGAPGEPAFTLRTPGGGSSYPMIAATAVRRLTPLECERLQGFPDGWTEGQSDAARYRQLGNAVAVPVVEWVTRRLVSVHARGEVAS
jgi:DNA (cytosine-5)-methyltransferase 1